MPVVPFEQTRALPPELRVPVWLGASIAAATVAGALIGWFGGDGTLAEKLLRAAFFIAAFAYAIVSIFDFYEHARLEHVVTGKWIAFVAVPIGESINHVLTGATILSMILYVGPIGETLDHRAWITLLGPLVFLALGWRDEVVYHRRRCDHREDIMHTTAHLAGGVMLVSLYAMRLS